MEHPPSVRARELLEALCRILGLEAGDLMDIDGLVAWCLLGFRLFARGAARYHDAKTTAERVAITVALVRGRGNISEASRTLGIARKVVRDVMRRHDCYPWPEEHARKHITVLDVLGSIDQPSQPGEAPPVVEDGRQDVVQHKRETDDGLGLE